MQQFDFPACFFDPPIGNDGDGMMNAANLLAMANRLSLEAVGVWFKMQCAEAVFDGLEVDDAVAARILGLDPRVWRRNRAELERAGVLTTKSHTDAIAA
jgi:hypothetical protein